MVGELFPSWVDYARSFLGVREIPGPKTSPTIGRWLHALKAAWSDDETPWCGTFVAHVMQREGMALPSAWYRAKAWADWGTPCEPLFGAIGVKSRVGGGHVFFCVGRTGRYIHALGGNQGNRVSVAPVLADDIIAYRWPATVLLGLPLSKIPKLPLTVIGAGGSEA